MDIGDGLVWTNACTPAHGQPRIGAQRIPCRSVGGGYDDRDGHRTPRESYAGYAAAVHQPDQQVGARQAEQQVLQQEVARQIIGQQGAPVYGTREFADQWAAEYRAARQQERADEERQAAEQQASMELQKNFDQTKRNDEIEYQLRLRQMQDLRTKQKAEREVQEKALREHHGMTSMRM